MRRPVIAGNWKMYKNTVEAENTITTLIPLVAAIQDIDIVLAPVFTVISSVSKLTAGTNIMLAAQDCYWENEGAYTGEISPRMLANVGCSHVIIGHSERRQYFGETNDTVNRKVKFAINAGLVAIFCIGENLSERESGKTYEVLSRQLSVGLDGINPADVERLIIAYEPVWAIGTGKTATHAQAQEAHAFIRNNVAKLMGPAAAARIRILYGGSVKPENICGLMSQPDIDGALVGGASLDAESFARIIGYDP